MFARITPYQMKTDTLDDAKAKIEALKSQVMGLPGIKQFINVVDDETGKGYVISLVESREVSDANAAQVSAIWGQFAEHLTAMPTPEGYDVFANWKN